MLFEPERHEPLLDLAWDAAQARAAMAAIVEDLEQSLGAGIVWPVHPLDAPEDGDASGETRGGYKSLYLGAAGALWALWYLEREGAVGLRFAPRDRIGRVHEAYLADPDTGAAVPSYYLGEVGILLVLWRLTGSREAADRLHAAIERNIPNPTNEALWAAPGTMVGAWHMHRWTGEQRWRDLFLENAEQLWRTWRPSPDAPCHLWTQDLYGSIVQLLGAGHGFAGNVYPLLRGAALLSVERRDQLYDRCVETLRATAISEGDGVNWPPGVGAPRPGRTKTARSVVPRRAGRGDRARRFSAAALAGDGSDADQGRRDGVGGGPAGQGLRSVPRHGRQRLCVPGAAPADRRSRSGSSAHGRSRCTRSRSGSACGGSTGADAARCGRAMRGSRCTCGTA